MRLMAMLISLGALAGGCAPGVMTSKGFCDVSKTMRFARGRTVEVLSSTDPVLLRDIIAHNEIRERLCGRE